MASLVDYDSASDSEEEVDEGVARRGNKKMRGLAWFLHLARKAEGLEDEDIGTVETTSNKEDLSLPPPPKSLQLPAPKQVPDACLSTNFKPSKKCRTWQQWKRWRKRFQHDNQEPEVSVKEEPKEINDFTIVKEEPNDTAKPSRGKRTLNYFTCNEDDCDTDDNSKTSIKVIKKEEHVAVNKLPRLPNPLAASEPQKLPSLNEASSSRVGSSVFMNRYQEAEKAKVQLLEKHVRLTEAGRQRSAFQPICWKFKRGQCSLGKNCRFFHDSDNSVVDDEVQGPATANNALNSKPRASYHSSVAEKAAAATISPEEVDDDSYMSNMKKKRRCGVNDNLMPPKKAYEFLLKERIEKRPWTLGGALG